MAELRAMVARERAEKEREVADLRAKVASLEGVLSYYIRPN